MSRFSLSSLRSRLLLLVLLAIIPALGLTLYTASEDRQREANHIKEDALRLAQIVSVEEEQLIRGTRQLLVTLAELPQVRDGDSTLCSAFFAGLLKQYHRYDNLGAIELDGDVFCSALPTGGLVNAADRGYFQRALQTRDFAIGDYQIGRITGKPSINFGYPVLDEDGQVQAVVFAALDLDWLNQYEYQLTAQLPQGSTLTKIDRDGVVLVHEPDPEKWVGQPALETPLAQTVLAQGQGVVEAVGLDGVPGVYAFAPVSSTLYARDMYVIIGIPEDVAFAEVNRVLARNLAGLGLVAVLALAAARAFGDMFILRQVNALLQATKRLSGGDLGARTALPPAQGELGQLARAFDQMAEALEQRAAERKWAEEALRESEKRYRQLVETSPDAIFVHSDRKFVFVNPATVEIFGAASPEELIGRPIRDIIHPDYWKIIEKRDQHVEQSEEGVGLLEEKLLRLDGTPIYMEAAGTSFTHQGKPAVQVCARDITERKRAEEALRQYVERLGILCEADQAILAAQSPQAIAQAALSRITQLVPCQRVGITLFDLEAHQLTVLAAHFTGESRVPAGARFPLEWFGADIERLRQGRVQVVEDVLALPQPAPGLQILQAEGVRSATCVPLISRGELIGSLNLVLDSPGGLASEYVDIAREVTDSLAVAIQDARLLEQVRAGHERLQTLSRRLMEVQEVERRHIARELHDEIGQALTVMKINLQAVQRLLDTPALAPYLEESIRTVDRTLQQVRNLSLDLRPSLLDDLGLVPALRWYVDRQAQQAGFSAQFAADPLEKRLPPDLEIVCFRIVQEALTNVTRHAQAQQVGVELWQRGDELQLIIRDDGVGFDVQTTLDRAVHGASMGLLGMEERALLLGGQVEIKSAPGRGTEIRARFPLTLAPSPEEGDEKGDSP
jgi:PAS domain S-box-containing protein